MEESLRLVALNVRTNKCSWIGSVTMKKADCFRDLSQFGIKSLTGEADALGYRILCDLDLQGVEVFKECFGMPCVSMEFAGRQILPQNGLADNWNSGSIASVMLPCETVLPLAIMGFYLQGYHTVLVTDKGTVFALEQDEKIEKIELKEDDDRELCYELTIKDDGSSMRWPYIVYGNITRIFRQMVSDGQIVQGTRNVHQMTGRVV